MSVAEIAELTGLSTRAVKVSIAALVAAGHVRRIGRYRKLVVTIVTPSARKPIFIPAEV
ncbi:MAG TPA: hypothetical protein VD866_15365 [Urbifossiella sp.]|nr:hypothetical protein [Urbifossiella sp.]